VRVVALLCAAIAFVVAGCGGGGQKAASTSTSGRVAIGQGLEGPAGLKATVYATGLRNVSAFAFDARDRLWVTTSAATKHSDDAVYLVRSAGAVRSR
jgi:glucose/arabinose dehydrogenase